MNYFSIIFLLILSASAASAADPAAEQPAEKPSQQIMEETAPVGFAYGKKGLQFTSADGNNFLWFGVRLQMRVANSAIRQDELPGEPVDKSSDAKLNRGRLKLGGHLLTPKFAVYTEYDFTSDTLLDFRVTYAYTDWLSIRVGQWKSEYHRERIDSSGAQQFVDRSILTAWFTTDRQKGVVASGRFAKGTAYDSSYWFGRLSGAGRGGDLSDAGGLWLVRYQWNFSGRVLGFSQSDIGRRETPAGSAAIAFVSGYSMFTSFSSDGGGQLPGFTDGESDQYFIRQALVETAWQGRGFSWQQELHWKSIRDRLNGTERNLVGIYAQAGMFFSEVWEAMPEPLELAVRYAFVDIDRDISGDRELEYSLAANWFFNGHRNKLTSDISYINRRMAPETDTNTRFRMQWDVSF